MWVGKPKITANKLPRLGDRDDFLVRAHGPGNTDYEFPVAITGTALAIWNEDSETAVVNLVEGLLGVSGTAKSPPKEGFWFDSYNSKTTLKETLNKISNEGISPFTKSSLNQNLAKQFGNELFSLINNTNAFFKENYGKELFRSFENAFEDSQAIDDLNTPPKDRAHFLYRICVLSVIIDHLSVEINVDGGSLQKLTAWLQEKLGEKEGKRLTATFQMIKNLRKQYPIHEEYETTAEGIRKTRKVITHARTFFNLKNNYGEDWHNVITKFSGTLEEIQSKLKK